MKTKHFYLAILILPLLLGACNKEKTYEVRYEVQTTAPQSALIEWTTSNGGISGGKLSDSWNKSNDTYRYTIIGTKGMEILLSGLATGNYADVKIRLYIDNTLIQSAESNSNVKAEIKYQL